MQSFVGQAQDKQFLRSILENNGELPQSLDPYTFANALLPNLGSSDSELRDELSYIVLASAIIDKKRLSPDQLNQLLLTVLDQNHLFFHIGEVGNDSVFMRSFSNLIVAAILYDDAKSPELPEQTIAQTKASLVRYAQQEHDWRGYIYGKGWAHAMAHLADSLDECAQNQAMQEADREDILNIVQTLAKLQEPLYNEEDIRLATAAQHIIVTHQVSDTFLDTWLASCYVERSGDVATWTSTTNMKNFLRSLYFLLIWDNLSLRFAEQVAALLRRLDDIYVQP
jgi:hypothetical protein